MKHLPIFTNISQQPCLVVGGGNIATRKAALLLDAGAKVSVMAIQFSNTLSQWAELGQITQIKNHFDEQTDVRGYRIIIAATDSQPINQLIAKQALAHHLLVNVVDSPEAGNFIMPSIVNRDPIQIAITTGGTSPILARLLRGQLEASLPMAYGRLAKLFAEFRKPVQQRFKQITQRRLFWEQLFNGQIRQLLFAGKEQQARQALSQALDNATDSKIGEVYLVGGGPGDPDLLTLRALRLMQQADVVLYDRLVSPPILDKVRRDARRIYVGKKSKHATLRQERINELLVEFAQQGLRVLRLKGGDPFIFGRGGEEIKTLAEHGIPFQVVPGITAASGCACYAGIPLTHRDYAKSCTFVTGHLKEGDLDLNWSALAIAEQTIVFYMGLETLPIICTRLIEHGLDPSTPAAIVQQGTTWHQQVLTSTVADLPTQANKTKILPPTIVIVGQVVKLHHALSWFETSPKQNTHWDDL